jgi:NAD(P)-dependent dehydrogenase (short-subunit alcohol dehydrogenase family)
MRPGRAWLLTAAGGWLAWRALRRRRAPFSFGGKTAIVTGGSRGLGFALARQLVARGARVAVLGRDEETLGRAHARLTGVGGEAIALRCDVADPVDVAAAVEVVRDLFGPVDLLVANAGTIAVGPLDAMDRTDFTAAMDVNFYGVLHSVLATLPDLRRPPGGRVIVISSIGGKLPVPHLLPYTASKFAAAGLAGGLRAELAKDGIAVTAVFPGLMRTGSPRHATFKGHHRAEYAWFAVADSLPIVSMDVEHAARRILAACRRGDAELVFPLAGRAAALAYALAPGATGAALAAVNRWLPGGSGGPTRRWTGEESRSPVAPSILTWAGRRAELRYNQIPAPDAGSAPA